MDRPDWKDLPTEEKRRIVEALAHDNWSAKRIAGHFRHASRNSIISWCHRNAVKLHGFAERPPRPAPVRRDARPAPPKPKPVRPAILQPQPLQEHPEPPSGAEIAFLLVSDATCRWPMWTAEATGPAAERPCCGLTPIAGSPYCAHHAARATGRRKAG